MKASEIYGNDSLTCNECGKVVKGHFNKQGKWCSVWKVLAGHIMGSRDHRYKKWAKEILLGADVGTGLFGDFRSSWGR